MSEAGPGWGGGHRHEPTEPFLAARPGELVLDHIVERKRLDDLCSSIIDGRFREQKVPLLDLPCSLLTVCSEGLLLIPEEYVALLGGLEAERPQLQPHLH